MTMKVVARVVQNQLQKLAEKSLPESQCGFRKVQRHDIHYFAIISETTNFFIVNLRKNTLHEALWKVLGKLGVPFT